MASIPPAESKVLEVVCDDDDWFEEMVTGAKRQESSAAGSSATAPRQSSMGTHRDRKGQGSSSSSSSSGTHELLSYDELPSWYRDNPYIRAGYRPVSHSARACLRSWGYLHNETVNIYTHLVPAAALLLLGEAYVLLAHLRPRYGAGLAPADYAVFALLLLAAAACLGLSGAYHTLMCHSREAEARWLRLDFVGIVVLILGSFVSGVYVGFWCEAAERKIYWAMDWNGTWLTITPRLLLGQIGSLALISAVVTLAPAFQGPRWRTLRLLTFVCTELSGLAPVAHGIHMFGFAQMARQSGLPYYLAEGGLFLLGTITYARVHFADTRAPTAGPITSLQLRFPERVCPGRFDIYGSSHQIFHVLVVVATVVHLVGVLDAFDYNYYNRQCSA